jgi:hypothetical protein
VREQFYYYKPEKEHKHYWIGKKLHYSIYMLSLREFNLDFLMGKIVFTPFKRLGNKLNFITFKNLFYYFVPTYLIGWVLYWQEKELPMWLNEAFPLLFGGIALLMIMKAFSERKNPRLSWLLVGLGHFWIALAVMHNENFSWLELIWYLSGVVIAGSFGYWALTWLRKEEVENFTLYRYYGHSYEYPNLAKGFMLCTLGLMGFPITTTFIGEDLIFGHIHENQFLLAFFLSSCFVIGGIALIRIYARLFLGPHVKTYHETPLQSS